MGFRWNGVHTSEAGLHAEARALPVLPEPVVVTEEVPGRDGFYDFSDINPAGRVHFRAREWDYRCSAEARDFIARAAAVARLFSVSRGWLEDDACPGVRWDAVLTNGVQLTRMSLTLGNFDVFFKSQAFAEGFDLIDERRDVDGGGEFSVVNPGTWYARPLILVTGTAGPDMRINGQPVPFAGAVSMKPVDWLELAPGANAWTVERFTGELRFQYYPRYVWN